ncbi:calcium-binding protein [Oceanibium sediminis]|uniref:calcium-binding protein n=1 Tax=Oceanibium sediminis TaxID=2026339 RepID=UPI000DD3EDEE|nr:calcium-binding protein [Oceanibium sediminis]
MLSIKATWQGFHGTSGIGTPIAPDVFLNGSWGDQGQMSYDPVTGDWRLDDRGTLSVIAHGSAPGAGEVTLSGLTYMRDGAVIARLTLPEPLRMAAHDDATGTGAPDWRIDHGSALEAAARADGFIFVGGRGTDVFAPLGALLPVHGAVTILGRGGDDILHGGQNDDVIRGGRGDDTLHDAGGDNLLHGGAGNDRLTIGSGGGITLAKGGQGRDHLVSGNGADTLRGNRGDDRLEGYRGNDRLAGGAGDDTLNGGEGDDRLWGGAGDDMLHGGWGADTFVFRAGHEGHDVLTDFTASEGDRLVWRDFGGTPPEIVSQGDHTLISWGDGASSVLIEWVTPGDLPPDALLF